MDQSTGLGPEEIGGNADNSATKLPPIRHRYDLISGHGYQDYAERGEASGVPFDEMPQSRESLLGPWKCFERSCEYFTLGWPTEKERDMHMNDKHAVTPTQYKCLYPPCAYTSKRETNCKLHMEKAHGWVYVRPESNRSEAQSISMAHSASSIFTTSNKSEPSSVPKPPLLLTPASTLFEYARQNESTNFDRKMTGQFNSYISPTNYRPSTQNPDIFLRPPEPHLCSQNDPSWPSQPDSGSFPPILPGVDSFMPRLPTYYPLDNNTPHSGIGVGMNGSKFVSELPSLATIFGSERYIPATSTATIVQQQINVTRNPVNTIRPPSALSPLETISEKQIGQTSTTAAHLTVKTTTTNSAQSDSGYHSGGGTDTESICSIESTGSSLGLPHNFLQDFIAFFGDTLIQKSGAQKWAEYTSVHRSNEETERRLCALLRDFARNMTSNTKNSSGNSEQVQKMLGDAARLVRRYRPKIARYFCNNSASEPVNAASLSDRLQTLGQQLSLMERFNLLEKSTVNQKSYVDVDPTEDDEDPGEDEITGEENILAGMSQIQDALVSSEPFQQLASDLRRALYRDDISEMEAIQKVVSETIRPCDIDNSFQAWFDIYWDIAGFMHSQYGEIVPVASVVVLTGSAFYAQATTCGEYVRTNWPTTGPIFLDILDKSLAGKDSEFVTVNTDDCFPSVHMRTSKPCSFLCVQDGNRRVIVELAQLLAWIGSAISISPFGTELAYTRPILKTPLQWQDPEALPDRESPDLEFELRFEHSPLHDTETACWLPLFNGASVASGFPIPDRTEEIGLEVPLELLAGLADIRHATEFEGGIVLKGFSHMFVPVKKTGDRIQWHAITREDSESRLTYSEGLKSCKSRALLEEVGFDDLRSTRAVVGWCCVVVSRLGSDATNYENIDYSGAKESGSVLRCAGGQVGLQQIGTGSLDFRFGAKDNSFHIPRLGRYQKIVSAAEKTPVVLYGTMEQRGWLVFASDVILHMIQHRHFLEPFEVEGKRVKLDTNVGTGSSAKVVLLKNEKTSISDGTDYTFKDVVLDIWSTLERLVDQNTMRSQNASGAPVKATLREFIRGYEFKAVVEERSPFVLKEQELRKTNGGWPLLARDINALILLADGFGEIFLPANDPKNALCANWRSMPSGFDYLATTSRMIKDLYNVAGCRVSRESLTSTQLKWHRGESLVFEACKDTRACQCDRLQQIFSKTSIGSIVSPGIIEDEGAVIFGRSGSFLQSFCSKSRQEPVQATGIYKHSNVHIISPEVQLSLEDAAYSDNSGQSGSDSTSDSIPASLSTCTTLSTSDTLHQIASLGAKTIVPFFSKKRHYTSEESVRLSDEHTGSCKVLESGQKMKIPRRHRLTNLNSDG